MDITPKDAVETKALGYGQRISTAIGIIIAMGTALLAAVGGLQWITDNLPLLGTGVGALVTGGITAYVAVRRMRVDKAKALLILLPLAFSLILSGCAVVRGKAGESSYVGIAFGEKASSTLAGLNVTETQTAKGQVVTDRGVGIDQAGSAGEADVSKMLGNLLLLGLQSQGVPVKAQASAASQAAAPTPEADAAPDAATADTAYSTDGYSGAPGASGVGIYGRPSCARCRAYAAANPAVAIINIDDPANRAAMWSALRRLGFTGTSASLPVSITPDAYTLSAK